jgi:hypothetical protein
LSERAWGTVREDYSPFGDAWHYLPHDHARSKAYRWNEDGLAGICDKDQKICFAVTLWNGKDAILKERLFGVSAHEGNHGEDVKECYYYLDNTPTHSYMKYLYKYPQTAFPYRELVERNRARDRKEPEWELMDSGVFDEERYFDVFVEYAKAGAEDILIRVTSINRGPESARLHVLPTVWFRNTWAHCPGNPRPALRRARGFAIDLEDADLGQRRLYCDGSPELLFTENETNWGRLGGGTTAYSKDGINDYLVERRGDAVNPRQTGTKGAAHYLLMLRPGEIATLRIRLAAKEPAPFADFDRIFTERKEEADEFYSTIVPSGLTADARNVMRQSLAGMLWSKQFYYYAVKDWLNGDPGMPPPPDERKRGRNHEWGHLYNADVIAMPDKWEYPWYAAWDLAFQCIPFALIDPDFAKEQLMLIVCDWYMHPNGQLPAYEWALDDVNPPVHAWAAWRVYQIEKEKNGFGDRTFLQRVFHKLLLNFAWWVNRKDTEGRNVFQGGFLGLDNIGIFDRSGPFPAGGQVEQADGTGWMAMYSLNMMTIAMELAVNDPAYEDIAGKFWEHFIYIANALNRRGDDAVSMWSEDDGFFYDVLRLPGDHSFPLKVKSMVGLIPLFAVELLDREMIEVLPEFKRRKAWFQAYRKDLTGSLASHGWGGPCQGRLLSMLCPEQLHRVLSVMLDENEFLSPHGIRALSRVHEEQPYVLCAGGTEYRVGYEPAESRTGLFGGNSNWRGPVWFPLNFLLIESLKKLHQGYQESFRVECPTGSGNYLTLLEVAEEISRRLMRIFLRDEEGRRPVNGQDERYRSNDYWRDLVLFYEYFHGDKGYGLGASHQTGWTGLVANLLQQTGNAAGALAPAQPTANDDSLRVTVRPELVQLSNRMQSSEMVHHSHGADFTTVNRRPMMPN